MAQRLKRWESPRREGRNDKGKGGSARQRQRRKQFQMLRQRLKDQANGSNTKPHKPNQAKPAGESNNASPVIFFLAFDDDRLGICTLSLDSSHHG